MEPTKHLDSIQPPSTFTAKYYLLLISCAYILAAANEYWIVNWFKEYGVKLPLYFAILQNSSWPIQIYFYLQECKTLPEKRVITAEMYRSYGFLGCLAAFINITRMFALANLPPVLTVICSNTEIVFETMMTVFVLKKSVSNYQYAAVALVITGVFVALYNPSTGTFGASSGSTGGTNFVIAVLLSILSRFASSLNTILAEKFLGKGAKSKIGVKECTLVNSIVPFFVLPFGLFITQEYRLWPAQLMHAPSMATTVAIVFLSIGICEAKHIDRFSKYAIVEHTSTIFFAGVDSAMKMLAGIMSFVLFPTSGTQFQWPYIVGFFFITVAIALLYVDKRNNTKKAAGVAVEMPVYNPMVDMEKGDKLVDSVSSDSSGHTTACTTPESTYVDSIHALQGYIVPEEEVFNPLNAMPSSVLHGAVNVPVFAPNSYAYVTPVENFLE